MLSLRDSKLDLCDEFHGNIMPHFPSLHVLPVLARPGDAFHCQVLHESAPRLRALGDSGYSVWCSGRRLGCP
jgi:hypothetical protein